MKILLTILSLYIFSVYGYSQTKLLFDATKAETASNADWIIDTDQFNLGYDPFPYIGGNESNPQQYPTPSQSGINSGTNEEYWTGALSAWGVDAVQLGYYTETLPYNGDITYGNSSNSQDLSNFDMFIVCEPNMIFSNAEKTAILNFVQDGGSLFMISDHDNSDRNGDGYDSPYIWNDLMTNNSVATDPFGFEFDYEFFDDATTNIPNLPGDPLLHGSFGDVTTVEFYGGTSMTLHPAQNSSVKGVVYRSGYSNTGNTGVLCAYGSYGNGKFATLGDSSPADDGSGDTGDNLYDGWIQDANGNHERLIMNATVWLAGTSSDVQQIHTVTENLIITTSGGNCYFSVDNLNKGDNYEVSFYDITGRTVAVNKNITTNQTYSVHLPNRGVYIYTLSNETGMLKSGKIVN